MAGTPACPAAARRAAAGAARAPGGGGRGVGGGGGGARGAAGARAAARRGGGPRGGGVFAPVGKGLADGNAGHGEPPAGSSAEGVDNRLEVGADNPGVAAARHRNSDGRGT